MTSQAEKVVIAKAVQEKKKANAFMALDKQKQEEEERLKRWYEERQKKLSAGGGAPPPHDSRPSEEANHPAVLLSPRGQLGTSERREPTLERAKSFDPDSLSDSGRHMLAGRGRGGGPGAGGAGL